MKDTTKRPCSRRFLGIVFWALAIPGFALFAYGPDSDGERMAYLNSGALLLVAAIIVGVVLFVVELRDQRNAT